MTEREWRFRDEFAGAPWPPGPWDDEPDKIEYRDPTTGAPVILLRGPLGQWCGYVAVPPGHPWHGIDPYECPAIVHGGTNYGERCDPDEPEHGVCHVAAEGEADDVWWLGFDCGHFTDVVPGMLAAFERYGMHDPHAELAEGDPFRPTYKDVAFVRQQCSQLAAQCAAESVPSAPWERLRAVREGDKT